MARKKNTGNKMTLNRAVTILLQEIADVRLELKQDIHALDNRMNTLENKVDHNHFTFMTYLKDVDGRVRVLERAKG